MKMTHKLLTTFLLGAVFFFSSCSKKSEAPPRLKVEELVKALGPVKELKKGDPIAVPFRQEYYGVGVVPDSYKVLAYKDIAFLVVEFETEEMASNEAKRLKQYFHKNWLIDEVTGEPSLEDLIRYKLKAVNPSLKEQRVPKHIPEEALQPEGAPAAPAAGGH